MCRAGYVNDNVKGVTKKALQLSIHTRVGGWDIDTQLQRKQGGGLTTTDQAS